MLSICDPGAPGAPAGRTPLPQPAGCPGTSPALGHGAPWRCPRVQAAPLWAFVAFLGTQTFSLHPRPMPHAPCPGRPPPPSWVLQTQPHPRCWPQQRPHPGLLQISPEPALNHCPGLTACNVSSTTSGWPPCLLDGVPTPALLAVAPFSARDVGLTRGRLSQACRLCEPSRGPASAAREEGLRPAFLGTGLPPRPSPPC